jgi:two-component system response regulator AtoC
MSSIKINTDNNESHSSACILPPEEVVFGLSAAMYCVRNKVNKVVGMDVPVLLEGEGGTGKELLARWIHNSAPGKSGPFTKVNCAAIPGTLLESELFGFEKGAFTGAVNRKPGRVELAQGGTLFLDEIAEIDRGLQAKLLQFLQDGRFSRIGSQEEQSVQTRIVCATNKTLEREIDTGRFRSDLYYRINVVRIQLPRLKERMEDLPILAEYFRKHYMSQFRMEREPLSAEMICDLQRFSWPGNIRELSNCIARYVLIGPEAAVMPETPNKHVKAMNDLSPSREPVSLKRIAKGAIVEMGRHLILEALRANQWNRKRAAQELKISYRALIYKIREAGIEARKVPSPRPRAGTDPITAD